MGNNEPTAAVLVVWINYKTWYCSDRMFDFRRIKGKKCNITLARDLFGTIGAGSTLIDDNNIIISFPETVSLEGRIKTV